jgi:hypothetical protein
MILFTIIVYLLAAISYYLLPRFHWHWWLFCQKAITLIFYFDSQ